MRAHRLNAALLSPSRARSYKNYRSCRHDHDRSTSYAYQRRPDQQHRVALAVGRRSAVGRSAPSGPCLGHCDDLPDAGRGHARLRALSMAAGATAVDAAASVCISAFERVADQPAAEVAGTGVFDTAVRRPLAVAAGQCRRARRGLAQCSGRQGLLSRHSLEPRRRTGLLAGVEPVH
ncbi:hypothetical protein D3C84_859160 [compost metagenome]